MSNFPKDDILKNDQFTLRFDKDRCGIMSLKKTGDSVGTNFLIGVADLPELDVPDARWFGHIVTTWRDADGSWKRSHSALSTDIRTLKVTGSSIRIKYEGTSENPEGIRGFTLEVIFKLNRNDLVWDIQITNTSHTGIEFGDIGIPLLFNEYFRGDRKFKYEQNVLRHTCLAGDGSWIYCAKSNGDGPILMMMTREGTRLEYLHRERKSNIRAKTQDGSPFGEFYTFGEAWAGLVTAYVHSACESAANPGTAQLPATSLFLKPGETVNYGFKFKWAENWESMGNILYQNGLIDVIPLPGMVIPTDDELVLLLRSKKTIGSLEPEFPGHTAIRHDGVKPGGYQIYRIRFKHSGVNRLAIRYGNKSSMILQFFILEPVEKLYLSNSAFITENQFETDPEDPCFHAFLMWDMTVRKRINSKCNPYGPDWFAGGSDEIGLVSGLFLSEKNLHRPDSRQLQRLDEYLSDFIEQRLTEQPGWRLHRAAPWFKMFDPWKGKGADDIWRAFNYVHVINTFYNMYRIRKIYDFNFMKPARHYLDRAYQYTRSMFSYWMFPDGVGATEYGNMGELIMTLELDKALYEEGMEKEAAWLKEKLDQKANYFSRADYPFGSEMAYDTTAFEAVYACGKRIRNNKVMKSAIKASFANRGRQPVWFWYNTDLRQQGEMSWNVSYMTQLAAWVLYDYTLNEGHPDARLIQSAYASYLAGWTMINSGYWDDHPENSGASCWIYQSEGGMTAGFPWLNHPLWKSAWPMSGESALGYFGALRMAAAIVVKHPVIGVYGYGCDVKVQDSVHIIHPRDGLRIRIYDTILGLGLELERDAFIKVEVEKKFRWLEIVLENITGDQHLTKIMVNGLPRGNYQYRINEGENAAFAVKSKKEIHLSLSIPAEKHTTLHIEYRKKSKH